MHAEVPVKEGSGTSRLLEKMQKQPREVDGEGSGREI